jgi:UDP-N-acetylmuramoyl-L-alanyl-D-glutamate--2,6-diaminopimelate ligase
MQELKNIYHLFQAILANIVYGFPARSMTVIGVTGTDGKTTTSSIIYHILEEAGKNAAVITSVGATIRGKTSDTGFHVTTPDSFALQKYLKKAKDAGAEYVVLETTSHGIDQNRVWGIPYEVGVITNVTKEHLDYHKTYDNYVRTKAELLKRANTAITNHDDGSYALIKKYVDGKPLITYGLTEGTITQKDTGVKTNLPGVFNVYNCLAAFAACEALGIDKETILESLLSVKLPEGREEVVYDKDFTIMIDFAHTPHAIEEILSAVRKLTKGRVIHVFGSAGERDHYKRPLMGKFSTELSDVNIVTAEDPRSEDVNDIIDQIVSGAEKELTEKIIRIPDRQEAINAAIEMAKKGDYVVITGKGVVYRMQTVVDALKNDWKTTGEDVRAAITDYNEHSKK